MFPPVDPYVSYPSLLSTFDSPIVAQALQAVYFTLVTYIIGYSVYYGTLSAMIVSYLFVM